MVKEGPLRVSHGFRFGAAAQSDDIRFPFEACSGEQRIARFNGLQAMDFNHGGTGCTGARLEPLGGGRSRNASPAFHAAREAAFVPLRWHEQMDGRIGKSRKMGQSKDDRRAAGRRRSILPLPIGK